MTYYNFLALNSAVLLAAIPFAGTCASTCAVAGILSAAAAIVFYKLEA